jgi:hypothetical protein
MHVTPKDQHLVMYLDIRNRVYMYSFHDHTLFMDRIKLKATEIFSREESAVDYVSMVVPSATKHMGVSYIFKNIKASHLNPQDIRNSIEYLKYRYRQESDTNDPQLYLETLAQSLARREEFARSRLILKLVLDVQTFFDIEEKPHWNFDHFQSGHISVEVVLLEERIFGPTFKPKMVRFKPEIRLELLRNRFSINSDQFDEHFEVNNNDFHFERAPDDEAMLIHKDMYPVHMRVLLALKEIRGWILIEETEVCALFKKDGYSSLICKIKQREPGKTWVTYSNIDPEMCRDVDGFQAEDATVASLCSFVREIKSVDMLENIKCPPELLGVFQMRHFYFVVPDFLPATQRTCIFEQIVKLLRGDRCIAVAHGRFLYQHDSFNTLVELKTAEPELLPG